MPDPNSTPQNPAPTPPNPTAPGEQPTAPLPVTGNQVVASPSSPNQGGADPQGIDALRSQMAALLARNQELEQADSERRQREEETRQAELTELEREREKVASLEEQIQELRSREELRQKQEQFWLKAVEGGASPGRRAALLRLVDLSATTLTEGGDLAGVEAVIEQARLLAPEFFGGSVTTNVTPTPGGEKPSERTAHEPESDFERGAQLMRSHKENKGAGRQRGRSKRL